MVLLLEEVIRLGVVVVCRGLGEVVVRPSLALTSSAASSTQTKGNTSLTSKKRCACNSNNQHLTYFSIFYPTFSIKRVARGNDQPPQKYSTRVHCRPPLPMRVLPRSSTNYIVYYCICAVHL